MKEIKTVIPFMAVGDLKGNVEFIDKDNPEYNVILEGLAVIFAELEIMAAENSKKMAEEKK